MNPLVHLFMANSIRKNVRNATGQKLHLAGFLYGNILPDLAKRFDEFPHYMEQSLGYISDAAAALSEHGASQSFAYSKNMGIITHYISDYFCYPHTKLFDGSLLSHLWYEVRMTLSYRKGRKLINHVGRSATAAVASCDLADNVKALSGKYCKERSHSRHDIAYAINSCSAVASGVVSESAALIHIVPSAQPAQA